MLMGTVVVQRRRLVIVWFSGDVEHVSSRDSERPRNASGMGRSGICIPTKTLT